MNSSRSARSAIPVLLLVVLSLASGAAAWLSSRPSSSATGPEGVALLNVPDLASASSTARGRPIDGITCQRSAHEVINYHIHAHVAVYVNGQARRLPAGIGLTTPFLVQRSSAGTFLDVGIYDCLYWLHTHVADGIVHVEAPHPQRFTLGQLFDIWRQPLGPNQVGPARGPVVVFENGRRLVGNPRSTPIEAHADIQLDVGTPVVAFQPFPFNVTGACGQGTNGCSAAKS